MIHHLRDYPTETDPHVVKESALKQPTKRAGCSIDVGLEAPLDFTCAAQCLPKILHKDRRAAYPARNLTFFPWQPIHPD